MMTQMAIAINGLTQQVHAIAKVVEHTNSNASSNEVFRPSQSPMVKINVTKSRNRILSSDPEDERFMIKKKLSRQKTLKYSY